ncbi:hypothetical protein LguiA_021281 [Lonicera macranthoides]
MEEERKNEGVVWLEGPVTPNFKWSEAEWKTIANFPNCTQSEAAEAWSNAASNNAGGVVLEGSCMECSSDKRSPNHQIDTTNNPAVNYGITFSMLVVMVSLDAGVLHQEKPQSTSSPQSTPQSSPQSTRKREKTGSLKKEPRPKPKIHRPKVVFDHVFKKQPPKKAKTPTPKVGVEGKPKRTPKAKTPKATPKPSTPIQSSPRKKRKYTRQNSVKKEDVKLKTGCKNEGAKGPNLEDAVKPSTKEVDEENSKCVEKSCRRTLNFDMESRMNEDLLETIFQYEWRNEEGAAISIANKVVAQESLTCVENSMTDSLNFESECQVKREPPKIIIHQYQRRKKHWGLAYKLVESKFLLEILRPNFPKAFNKRRKNRKRVKTSLEVVSPTRDQIRAALNDPDSFKCVRSLYALRKSKRRTSNTRRQRLTYLDANPNPNLDQLPTERSRLAYLNLNELPLNLPSLELKASMGKEENIMQPAIDKNCELKAACVEVQCDDKENTVQPAIEVQFEGNENMVEFTIDINRESCMEFHFEGRENMMQPAVDNAVIPASYQGFHPQFEDVLHEAKMAQQEPKAALGQGFLHKLLINALSQRLEFLCISSECNQKPKNGRSKKNNKSTIKANECNLQLMIRGDQSNEDGIVGFCRGKNDKKNKPAGKVDLDPETMRVWNYLMENDRSGGSEEVDEEKEKWWRDERSKYDQWLKPFTMRMRYILGNRRFSPWKGSVVYSVVGAYLTQNVSDHLSSSAVMALAARFPRRSACKQIEWKENVEKECSQESEEMDFFEELYAREDDKLSQKGSPIDGNIVSTEMEHPEDSLQELVGPEKAALPSTNRRVGEKETLESKSGPGKKRGKVREKQQETTIDWDELRKKYWTGRKGEDSPSTMDPVDWDAVRQASVDELAETICERGMNNVMAARIKDFLDRMVRDHGSTDLEWLRDVPPDKAKEFLLSISGLGLKSVECIRLLTLHHVAFPVDTNVGRVAVRLGWVPLQPLPDEIEIHDLKVYELHYQLITFGKVFCTKHNPNCNECPMREDCKHYKSARASNKLFLHSPGEKISPTSDDILCPNPIMSVSNLNIAKCQNEEPIFEEPPSPYPVYIERDIEDFPEPLAVVRDIEDFGCVYDDDMPVVKLNTDADQFRENLGSFIRSNDISLQGGELSNAIVQVEKISNALVQGGEMLGALPLKNIYRLRTVHKVYRLPDRSPLLAMLDLDPREPDDPCPYLLAIWTEGGNERPENQCNSQEPGTCNESSTEGTIPGTVLIPCRTANRGSFPLNGTYFQVNEVFADDESSQVPIEVPRALLWDLDKCDVYCGASATSIFKGFMCVRGFNRKTRAPRPLSPRFHQGIVATAKANAAAKAKRQKFKEEG